MKIPSPNELMNSHVQMNLGVYFSEVHNFDHMHIATSKTIKDFYWNYAFSSTSLAVSTPDLADIVEFLGHHDRTPAIWQIAGSTTPDGWVIQSREAWMWRKREEWTPLGFTEQGAEIEIRFSTHPNQAMQNVFQDAYGSGVSEGDVGYYELPVEYSQAYLGAEAQPPVQICQLSAWIRGTCVAIATSCVNRDFGGIYSVATAHGYRNKGCGKLISLHAANWAFQNGAKGVFLQTSVDSPVEKLYSEIGFKTLFIGELLTLTLS